MLAYLFQQKKKVETENLPNVAFTSYMFRDGDLNVATIGNLETRKGGFKTSYRA